jgi:hypothetical protein
MLVGFQLEKNDSDPVMALTSIFWPLSYIFGEKSKILHQILIFSLYRPKTRIVAGANTEAMSLVTFQNEKMMRLRFWRRLQSQSFVMCSEKSKIDNMEVAPAPARLHHGSSNKNEAAPVSHHGVTWYKSVFKVFFTIRKHSDLYL